MEQKATSLVKLLQDNGYQAYFVGGYVRNKLFKLPFSDIDIATSALPEQVIKVLKSEKIRYKEVGKSFGVVLASVGDFDFEIATFRKDGIYSDGRRPDSVQFSDIKTDSGRRDFTINAMYYNPINKDLIDFHNGYEDICAKILRFVGDAKERIEEDNLRILRAIRFATIYNLSIEAKTAAAIYEKRDRINNCSAERIREEVVKGLSFDANRFWQNMMLFGLHTSLGIDSVGYHLYAIRPSEFNIDQILSILLIEVDDFRSVLKRLKFDNKSILKISEIIEQISEIEYFYNKNGYFDYSRSGIIKKMQIPYWKEIIEVFLKICPQAFLAFSAYISRFDIKSEEITEKPWISGDDLINLGLTPDKSFSKILNDYYDKQLNLEVSSREEALILLKNDKRIFHKNQEGN